MPREFGKVFLGILLLLGGCRLLGATGTKCHQELVVNSPAVLQQGVSNLLHPGNASSVKRRAGVLRVQILVLCAIDNFTMSMGGELGFDGGERPSRWSRSQMQPSINR